MTAHGKKRRMYPKQMIARIILLIFSVLIYTSIFSQDITLSLKKVPLEKAFREIEKKTDHRFVYTKEMAAQGNPVTLDVRNASLKKILDFVFESQPLEFSLDDKFITVRFKTTTVTPVQTGKNIQGKVLNEKGEPLNSATVQIKTKNIATATEDDGSFFLKYVDEEDVLVISNVGYGSKEIPINGKTDFTIYLNVSITALDETVVIAYGTTTNRLNTGNVTKVSGQEISKQPVSNPLAALQGRVPGMIVTQSSGLPGASIQVQIRGRTALDPSITDDQPLYVIDGIPYAPNNNYLNVLRSALGNPGNSPGLVSPGGLSPFNSISPSDIESIEVLKDADATAIYGSRGANGVILISTKKGKAGKTVFNFSMQTGISKVTRSMDMLSTQQYLGMRREAFKNDGITPTQSNAFDLLIWDTTRYTDFKKLLIGGTAKVTDIQGSISGGNTNTQFLFGSSYHYESTVFPGNLNDKRGTIHFNAGHSTTDQKFRIQLSGSYTSGKNNLVVSDLTSFINSPPNLKLYDSVGKLAWNEGGIVSNYNNPLAYLNQSYSAKTDNLIGNLQLNYKVNNNIFIRLNTGYSGVMLSEGQANPFTSQNPLQNPVRSSTFATNQFKSWIIEPQAEYIKNIFKGKITALVGNTFQNQSNDISSVTGLGYIDDALLGSLSGATSVRGNKSFSQYRYAALFARLNYNWLNKYILNLSGRRDGSSRFGTGKQFANFGSIGAAWIFSNEILFEKRLSLISFGKLRTSYGTTGNDKIANYQYLDTWNPTDNSYQNGAGLSPIKLFNPDYQWEKTTKFEGAIDLGFIKDRLLFSMAYYRNRSSNQLVQYKLPTTTGFTNIIRNLPAIVQNSGWEISITSNTIMTSVFKWTTSANISVPRNKLISFPGLSSSSYATQYVIGKPLNVINKYKYAGVDSVTGLYTVEDANKDGSFTLLDYQPLGSLDPKFFGGIQNSFQYKDFQLDFFVQFVKQSGTNYLGNSGFPAGSIYNIPDDFLNRWQTPGDKTDIQKFTQATNQPAFSANVNLFRQSDGVYSDASFVRLKNVSISYRVTDKLINKAGSGSCRFYLSGQNLITITNYKGSDPETQNYLRMPPLRTIVGGVQFTF